MRRGKCRRGRVSRMRPGDSNSASLLAGPIASSVERGGRFDWFAGKRVLVTGSGGFLGRAVVRRLRGLPCEEIAVPRRSACDLTRRENIDQLLSAARPDIVIHLAARVDNSPGQADAAACFCDNVLMSTQLIDAVARRGVEKLVCVGSAASFPESANVPLCEADLFAGLPEAFRQAHGVAKRLPLIQMRACRKQYGLRFAFLIASNLYGPGDHFDPQKSNVIPSLVRAFTEAAEFRSPEVTLRGSGNITRDFLHIDDCAEAILLASERYDSDEPANLGSGMEVQIRDLAARVGKLAGYSGKICWDGSDADGAKRRLLDTERAAEAFGFRARRDFDDGLREVVESYRAQQHNFEPRRERACASPA